MREMKSLVGRLLLSVAASLGIAATGCLIMAPAAHGQGITTGTITGTVVDPSGAAIPNANVIATSNAQGTERQHLLRDQQVSSRFMRCRLASTR